MHSYFHKDDVIAHEGVAHDDNPPGRGSGRYAWGSGDNPNQHTDWSDWQETEARLKANAKAKGITITDTEIAQACGITVTMLRARRSAAKEKKKKYEYSRVTQMHDHGYSNRKIADALGMTESNVRYILKTRETRVLNKTEQMADVMKEAMKDGKYLYVGKGTELYLGCSEQLMKNAINNLVDSGEYKKQYLKVEQQNNPGKYTSMRVLTPADVEWKFLNSNEGRENITLIQEAKIDMGDMLGGKTSRNMYPPESLDRSRILVRYNEEGGADRDGTIELRRGVSDIALGNCQYAQVRIKVGDEYYMKGMAHYSNNIPDGYDVVYNSNKPVGSPDDKVFKKLSNDPDNPFGATIKVGGQRFYVDKDGKEHLSVINKINEEGDWSEWSKTISSQMLSKQKPDLVKRQLDITYKEYESQYEDICSIKNPVVRKEMLLEFADELDSASCTLKAAAFPRQAAQVLLPMPSLKENEIYAPNFRHGETVVLVRHPHAGTFESPELRVNNNIKEGKEVLGQALRLDAVGINPKVAEQLSGADFDGDTALVIPNNDGKIQTSRPLEQLKGFDPKINYGGYDPDTNAYKLMTESYKQKQMGVVSNLITDMTLLDAPIDDIAKAVKHSMVVIDSVKHKLDYTQSGIDNDVKRLKQKYQGGGGVSTIVSRAKSETTIPERDPNYRRINPDTGEVEYRNSNRSRIDDKGEVEYFTERIPKMLATNDARTLMSDPTKTSGVEYEYATYANKLKALARETRKNYARTDDYKWNKSSEKEFPEEVATINAKLAIAKKNAPLMAKAQLMAETIVKQKIADNPELKDSDHKEELRKLRRQTLEYTKGRMGASRTEKQTTPTEQEWKAIEAGAISPAKLRDVMRYSDSEKLKELAMPRAKETLTSTKIALIKAMFNGGRTQSEIADYLGVSTSTISRALAG